mmetsp:Transcript_348/g.954  ORF Transcript_348/g.954 Transcript_348/m.954 type:complete len:286 (-) Transcript_348:1701-2558(-)
MSLYRIEVKAVFALPGWLLFLAVGQGLELASDVHGLLLYQNRPVDPLPAGGVLPDSFLDHQVVRSLPQDLGPALEEAGFDDLQFTPSGRLPSLPLGPPFVSAARRGARGPARWWNYFANPKPLQHGLDERDEVLKGPPRVGLFWVEHGHADTSARELPRLHLVLSFAFGGAVLPAFNSWRHERSIRLLKPVTHAVHLAVTASVLPFHHRPPNPPPLGVRCCSVPPRTNKNKNENENERATTQRRRERTRTRPCRFLNSTPSSSPSLSLSLSLVLLRDANRKSEKT